MQFSAAVYHLNGLDVATPNEVTQECYEIAGKFQKMTNRRPFSAAIRRPSGGQLVANHWPACGL